MSLRRDLPAIDVDALRAGVTGSVYAMARRSAAFTQADVTRAIKAAKAAGVEGRIDIRPDGTISILLSSSEAADAGVGANDGAPDDEVIIL